MATMSDPVAPARSPPSPQRRLQFSSRRPPTSQPRPFDFSYACLCRSSHSMSSTVDHSNRPARLTSLPRPRPTRRSSRPAPWQSQSPTPASDQASLFSATSSFYTKLSCCIRILVWQFTCGNHVYPQMILSHPQPPFRIRVSLSSCNCLERTSLSFTPSPTQTASVS